MAQATIVIGNLKTNALYVSSFHAEVFSDSGYSTLVGSQTSAAVKDLTGAWVQSDLIIFPGLVRGQMYYVKAGPVSPVGIENLSSYSLQAGTIVVPNVIYPGTFTATTSGVAYDITPHDATTNLSPTGINHYEAIWTKDGSAPSNSSLENAWTGNPVNGVMHLFIGGNPGDNIHLFMRAVSNSGGYQNWYAVDNRSINTAFSGTVNASGVTYADGKTVQDLQPGQAGADVTGDNTAADTSAVNGINAGHIADTATSLGFVGKWWRTSSGSPSPANGGELPYAPMFTTHDAFLNYNIFGYNSWANSVQPPSFAPYPPTGDGQWIYARFTGYFVCSNTGTYTFGVNSDDGANLYVNEVKLVSDLASTHGANGDLTYTRSGMITLTAGDTYEIVVEYRNGVNNCGLQVLMTPPGGSVQLVNLGTAFKSAAFTQYANGQTVDALRPAQAGADVTAQNTSANTTNVGTTPSSTVASVIPSAGKLYINSGSRQYSITAV